jgi:hypothetical protein
MALDWGQFRRLLGAEWASLIGDFALLPVIPFVMIAADLVRFAVQLAIAATFLFGMAAVWQLVESAAAGANPYRGDRHPAEDRQPLRRGRRADRRARLVTSETVPAISAVAERERRGAHPI